VIYPLDTITLNNQLNAYFVPSSSTAEIWETITFDEQSTFNVPGATWDWEFGDFDNSQLIINSEANTTHVYQNPYYYTVTLTVTDINGCTDQHQTIIHITGNVSVPNVFTPNGDGINDVFAFPYDLFKSYDVIILNRWGNEVYNRTKETETYIWNGSDHEKEQCVEGVYFYLIKGIILDNSPFEVTGYVTKI